MVHFYKLSEHLMSFAEWKNVSPAKHSAHLADCIMPIAVSKAEGTREKERERMRKDTAPCQSAIIN